MKTNSNTILVVDFGSQYNHLITRRFRDLGIRSMLVPYQKIMQAITPHTRGIVLSGGPQSVYDESAYQLDPRFWEQRIPVLGICYGLQYFTNHHGGNVIRSKTHEYGLTTVELTSAKHPLISKVAPTFQVWMSHADQVEKLAPGYQTLATSAGGPHVIVVNDDRKFYGIQFHPEVRDTEFGNQFLRNFAFNICGVQRSWSAAEITTQKIAKIRQTVGDDQVILGLSGGVDSGVTAALIGAAIGEKLTCVFIDNGLLRKDEANIVTKSFTKIFPFKLIKVDAQETFLERLANVRDPEQKRQVIGATFIEEFVKICQTHVPGAKWLAQGTLYTDVVESGTGNTKTIKSHHNVGGLPKKLPLKLLEPLRDLYKDEVRDLGHQLKLPAAFITRPPFPGPGLAIRIIGLITPDKLRLARESDAILQFEINRHPLYKTTVWQYFTVVLDSKTVGVKGDNRSYEQTIAIRAVTSVDGMTARAAEIDYKTLFRIANRITNEVAGVNRVVYDLTSKPPGTIEWE